MREKAMLLFKKYHPNKTKQNETLAQRESGNRYETNKKNKPRKNENLYKNGRKANLKVVQVRIIESQKGLGWKDPKRMQELFNSC